MKFRFHFLVLTTAALVAAGPAHAAFNPAVVSADARWVVHLDFNALRASAIGQELVAAIEKEQAGATGGMVGLDVAKVFGVMGGLTAYGANLDKNPAEIDGALIAQGTPNLGKIAESLLLQGTIAHPAVFAEVADFPFPVYSISDPKAKAEAKTQVLIAFPPEPIVIVSKSRAQLLKARDVFRGTVPSLAKTPASPLNRLGAHADRAYLYAATVVPAESVFPQNAPQTRMLLLANAGSIAIGDRDQNTFAHAELIASSGQNAEKLTKILQGMTAVLSLAETTDKQLAEFINSTMVARAGNTVTLDLAYSSARLAAMAQSLRQPAHADVPRVVPITSGRTVAEWTAEQSTAPDTDPANASASRTIENVELKNGAMVSLGWRANGAKSVRYHRVEITPAQGGMALVFRSDTMRAIGGRGNMAQFSFPGVDGTYTLKVTYANDPEGKVAYAVSVRDPRPPQ